MPTGLRIFYLQYFPYSLSSETSAELVSAGIEILDGIIEDLSE